jgi:hypothetical protein
MARKYLVTEMMGAIPTVPPFTMYLCSDCRLHAEWLYGRPSEDELAYWWHMERCDVVLVTKDIHALAAAALFDVAPNHVNPWQRKLGKNRNHAALYSQHADWRGMPHAH